MTKRIHFPLRETVAAVTLTFTALTGLALAHEYSVGPLKIDHPWARATPRGAKVGGGYAVITNTGSMPDRLVGGSLTAAGRVEIHRMTMEGDVMEMGPVEGGLEIKPGQTVKLEPGGLHIMFMDLAASLKQGEMVKGTLSFERAGTVPVEFAIDAIAAKAPEAGHAHHH
jgi:periplasmic copper chaperone A